MDPVCIVKGMLQLAIYESGYGSVQSSLAGQGSYDEL